MQECKGLFVICLFEFRPVRVGIAIDLKEKFFHRFHCEAATNPWLLAVASKNMSHESKTQQFSALLCAAIGQSIERTHAHMHTAPFSAVAGQMQFVSNFIVNNAVYI